MRNREVKNLMIHNKTNQVWLLKPVIDGEYWTGADTITIDPQTGKNYEIAYRPLTMTVEHKKHTVSCFKFGFQFNLHCYLHCFRVVFAFFVTINDGLLDAV